MLLIEEEKMYMIGHEPQNCQSAGYYSFQSTVRR